MLDLLLALWPLFALIVGGHLLRRLDFVGEGFWPGAERINYFILFPALLFRSLATAPLDNPALPRVALCVTLVLATAMAALEILRRYRGWMPDRHGVFVQGVLRFNTYIGLATVGTVFGPDGLTLIAVLLALTVPAVNVLSIHAFTPKGSARLGTWLLALLRNPLILACLLGTAFNLTGLKLSGGTDTFLSLLAATSLPLGLLSVGAALQPQDLRGEKSALLMTSVARLLIMPLVAWLFVRLLGLPPMESAVVILFFALPSAPTAYVLTRQFGGDARLMAGIITLQTLLAALTLPLIRGVVS